MSIRRKNKSSIFTIIYFLQAFGVKDKYLVIAFLFDLSRDSTLAKQTLIFLSSSSREKLFDVLKMLILLNL